MCWHGESVRIVDGGAADGIDQARVRCAHACAGRGGVDLGGAAPPGELWDATPVAAALHLVLVGGAASGAQPAGKLRAAK